LLDKITVGWREFCALPTLGIPAIKAKIDTGARTSALHTSKIKPFTKNNQEFVTFLVHPVRLHPEIEITCTAKVSDKRLVKNSGGIGEMRYVIITTLCINNITQEIELTLTNREQMKFRMLLGREALKQFAIIDPSKSFCQGRYDTNQLLNYYSGK
jgi:ribosomal protein S6--L-glutamate ligase